MRIFLSPIIILLMISACGSSGGNPFNGNPDAGSIVVLPGSADAATPAGGGDDLPVPAQGFQIKATEIMMPAGSEETYCYYFTIPGAQATGVKRWQSKMTPGSHHLIVYFTATATQPDGTVDKCSAFAFSLNNIPIWTYSSAQPNGEGIMPQGVGMQVNADQHGYVQMHYLNVSDEDQLVHVTVNGETFAPGEPFIQAAAYVTFNTQISIPAGVGMTGSAEGSCRMPSGAKFFAMSTHSHRRSVGTWVKDGSDMILQSQNWEHPTIDKWEAPSFYSFNSNLVYHCDYVNDLDQAVRTGQSAKTDEMCMAVGYFFPATGPVLCLNSTVFSP